MTEGGCLPALRECLQASLAVLDADHVGFTNEEAFRAHRSARRTRGERRARGARALLAAIIRGSCRSINPRQSSRNGRIGGASRAPLKSPRTLRSRSSTAWKCSRIRRDTHVGHVRNYMIGDVVARMKRMRGFNVLHPFGWDAFGLPAENAAIKNGIHPETSTLDNIAHMKGQLQRLGISYAWERELATCLPDYYKWNQWVFIKMLERDLAFRRRCANWCPTCQTVLANEQVVNGAAGAATLSSNCATWNSGSFASPNTPMNCWRRPTRS